MSRRIELFLALPIAKLDSLAIKRRMDEIGQVQDAAEKA
jgi:hypothetical protein